MAAPRIYLLQRERPAADAGPSTTVGKIFNVLKRARDEGRSGVSISEIELMLNLSRKTIYYALDRFTNQEKIVSRVAGKRGTYRLNDGIDAMPSDRRGKSPDTINRMLTGLKRFRAMMRADGLAES